MILAALVDGGVPLDAIRDGLRSIPLKGYRLDARSERRGALAGTRVLVEVDPATPQPRRTLGDILALLDAAKLPDTVHSNATSVFRALATAEAKVHGIPAEEVHFHEVGAVDSIVDVVGGLIGLEALGVSGVYSAPLPVAPGTIRSSHGLLPLPAPAMLELAAAAGAPIHPLSIEGQELGELVTPTAAAVLTTVATFRQPAMQVERIGYGVGTRDNPALPNVLRLWLGESADVASDVGSPRPTGRVQLLETNIDDMNPELYGYVAELLFAAGALDVWYTSIQMKKGRPGTLLAVLAAPDKAAQLAGLLLRETSTLGVRTRTLERWEAERSVVQFASSLGPAAVKIKRWQGDVLQVAPEYESCKALAEQSGLPLAEVYRRIESEARAQGLGNG